MVGVESIGAGGGSIARTEPTTGALKVGPDSAGAVPGPACYGQGGLEPTVTDANLILGYLDADRTYGGRIRLDQARAEAALRPVARHLGLSLAAAAQGIVQVANASMLRALRLVSVQRGYDLRDFALIAYGGAGPLHAGALALEAGMARVIVPAHSGVFSALGCLVSPLAYDAAQTYRVRLESWDGKVAEDRFRALEGQCLAPLADEGFALDELRAAAAGPRLVISRAVDLRYSGQNYEIAVPWDGGGTAALRASFEHRHRQLYGYATGESVECVTLRVTARVERDWTSAGAPEAMGRESSITTAGMQRAVFPSTGEVTMPRYDRGALPAGRPISGPALVEDEWSTIVVYPGQRAAADSSGNLTIDTGR
jgi:N-methylhydantoinase A